MVDARGGGALELSNFEAADQSAVRELVLAGLGEHWGTIDASLNPDLDDIATSYAEGVVLVGRIDGCVVATGTVVPRSAEHAEVVRMSVATGLRGRGLGRAVLAELEARAASELGVTRILLETNADWTETVAFYLACGYRITHHEDGPYCRDAYFEKRLEREKKTPRSGAPGRR